MSLKLDSIITNGYVDPETIEVFTKEGHTFVCTIPAILAHPHAMPTDKLTIFAKYEPIDIDDPCKEGDNKLEE